MQTDKRFYVEMLGIVAVVVSLLFVASELRLSNSIATRESREAIVNMRFELNKSAYLDPEVAEFLAKLGDSSQTLNDGEQIRAEQFAATHLSLAGLLNSSYESGTLPDEVMNLHLNYIVRLFDVYPVVIPFFEEALKDNTAAGYVFNRLYEEVHKR